MDRLQESLFQRISEFAFDEPGRQRTFVQRLAAENGWARAKAARAVSEYRRFVFLAMTAGHVVCPSDEVDEVWHLHLTYTRSYRAFCSDVLGRALDHDPSQGGAAELAKHRQMYAQTLASYQRIFGESPPADLWPSVDERFCGARLQKVDASRYWLLPKPSLRRMAIALEQRTKSAIDWRRARLDRRGTYCFAAGGLVFAAGFTLFPLGAFRPLEMAGPAFLGFYLLLTAAGFAIGYLIRYWARRLDPVPMAQTPVLDPYETAFLAGGERRAINAAIATLVRSGNLDLANSSPATFTKGPAPTADRHPLERATYDAFGGFIYSSLKGAQQKSLPSLAPVQQRLRELGLFTSARSNAIAVATSLLVMLCVIAVGIAKINIGMDRGKPTGFLVVLVGVTAILSLATLTRRLGRTPHGDQRLAQLRAEAAELQTTIKNEPDSVSDQQLVTALGLFGFGLMAAYPLGNLHAVLAGQQIGRSSGGGGISSGCGGACGSGGGGCGGGGGGCGGGCGGCS